MHTLKRTSPLSREDGEEPERDINRDLREDANQESVQLQTLSMGTKTRYCFEFFQKGWLRKHLNSLHPFQKNEKKKAEKKFSTGQIRVDSR